MNHPGDGPLNEYVDDRLDRRAKARVQAHLEECAVCHERVEAIRGLNAELAALPGEIAPRRDLKAGVLRRVAETAPAAASPAPVRTATGTRHSARVWLRAAVVALLVAGGGTALWLGIDGGNTASAGPDPLIGSYASAAVELARTVEGRKAELGPAGARAFDRSLAAVEAAIRELERARQDGDADGELLRQLEARHRARLELLRGAVTLLEES
jgi:hypothetical protein